MKECKKCKSNEYTNKQLVMMINECGHPLCKNCVDNIFALNSGNCHVCNRVLRKNNFREQIYEDPLIDKETFLRRKLRKIYNLKQDDFENLREFGDYQERFETVVYNLVFETNVNETNAEIQAFEEKHKEQIDRNKRRLDDDQKWIEDQLREERAMKARMTDHMEMDAKEQEAASAVTDTRKIMDELRDSNVAAEVILDRERKKQIEKELEEKEEQEKRKRRNKEMLQTRKRAAENMSFNTVIRVAGRAYVHQPLELVINGPPMPNVSEIEALGYLAHIRQPTAEYIAGGYTPMLGCSRALFEARIDLFSF
ncbi:CDK-activating kinase assembly factor MAT1 [Caenorhabditis elegans]|uniref:CDK-activating kinase assembly factor MAT1 n=1 Tax=Caenorhabditis elegans TaxID=6239 RepID=O17245_CAEEL|nr:CDK-activating kinase assembly factor MAT1 [Caenorhabditis elegans]CCD71696.1 CDK-activating kinase assembly factor MAT1 [Caenorhabditis elegans]|eukprot:NP_494280.3 MNAT (menage a trois) TFIIH subunit [Caenorhabditis elegans]